MNAFGKILPGIHFWTLEIVRLLNLTLFLVALSPLKTFAQAKARRLNRERFSIHTQTTVINQFKPAFAAPYAGPNSLSTEKESQTSITSTFFLGTRLWKGASVHINPEIAGGSGLSQVLGIAAATNGETFRIGNPAPKIYFARLFFRQVIALSSENSVQESDFNVMGGPLPEKYLSFTVGKIGVADYFDNNSYSHDPRTQFMSWALMSNGAWDLPGQHARLRTQRGGDLRVSPARVTLRLFAGATGGQRQPDELGHRQRGLTHAGIHSQPHTR